MELIYFILIVLVIAIVNTILHRIENGKADLTDFWDTLYQKEPKTNLPETFGEQDIPFYDEVTQLHLFLLKKKEYLDSSLWKEKRKKVLARANYECENCSSPYMLQIHHTKDYKLIPFEPIESLVCLCANCHEEQHRLFGYPSTIHDYMDWYAPLIK